MNQQIDTKYQEAVALPVWRGYAVDKRCREFRQVVWGKNARMQLIVIPFDSAAGDELLARYIRETGDYCNLFT